MGQLALYPSINTGLFYEGEFGDSESYVIYSLLDKGCTVDIDYEESNCKVRNSPCAEAVLSNECWDNQLFSRW